MTTVALKYPIQNGGGVITSITMRRPKARDMVQLGDHIGLLSKLEVGAGGAPELDGRTFEAMIAVISCLADLPPEVVGELDMHDLVEVATAGFSTLGELGARAGQGGTGSAQ